MTEPQTTEILPPYEGNDMAGYIMAQGFKLPDNHFRGDIKSITNVRDTAIIVTDAAVWRAKPQYQVGFSIEMVCWL